MKHRVLTTDYATAVHLLELQTARPEPVVGCATHGAKDSADDVIALKARKVLSSNSGESGSGRRRSSRRQQQRRGRRRREGGRRRRRSPRSRTMRLLLLLLLLLRRRDEPRAAQYALVAPTASTASVAERGRSWGKWLRAWRRSWAVWPWRVCGRQQRWPEQSAMPLRCSAVSLLGSRRQ